MIDWGKLGPANSPQPNTTTAPVAPTPGSMTMPLPTRAPVAPAGTQPLHPAPMTQQQVDGLDPGQRIGRGIDFLGDALFGKDNGSALGGVPLLGDIVGAGGRAAHEAAADLIVKPIEVAAATAARVPLGWLPGGADDNFNLIGDWAKKNDPQIYQHWQTVQAAGEGDKLMGGNMKADFNMEVAKYLDDQTHEGILGTTPGLALGRAAVGSLGGGFAGAVTSWLGLAGNTSQRVLGAAGLFDPTSRTGLLGMNRIEESGKRLDAGEEVSDIEKQAVEAVRSGAWTMEHGEDFLVSHGQGITRNAIGQLVGSAFTDPLTYATLGAGAIAKAGTVGVQAAEAAGAVATTAKGASLGERAAAGTANLKNLAAMATKADSTYEKLALTVAAVQKSQMGPAFRIARGLVDPLAVYKPSTVQRAVTELRNGVAVSAYERATGRFEVREMRAIGREFDKVDEVDSAMASYAIDKANEMVTQKAQREALGLGLGPELLNSDVDGIAKTLSQNAGRDAETELTDHIMDVAKNTFTPEEESSLSGRLSVMFGNDLTYWVNRMKSMSHGLKSALHNVTYKRAEVDFEQARALINEADYKGDLPLRNMALLNTDTLDNETAQSVIDNIRAVLKSDDTSGSIAAGTAEWNAQARRYPAMAQIGIAPGGKEQLQSLVDELDKQLQAGGITRRATEDEISDPVLKSVKDMLDRHTVGGQTFEPVTGMSPKALMDEFQWPLAKAQGLVDNAEMVPTDILKPLREIDRRAKPELSLHGDLETLKSSIESNGGKMAAPIIVWHDPETLMTVVADGNHRLTVAIEQGWEKVPVVVEIHPASEISQAENIATIARITPQAGAPKAGIIKPSAFFPEAKGQPLWRVGFRPDEEVAWGLKHDHATGSLIVDRNPTISHVVDAVPGRQHFSDTTRNVLGQMIGKSGAERLNRPIDSMEAFMNTMRDGVTGRRLVKNIEQRFERSTFDAGIPKPLSKEIFKKAREVAGLDYTTVRGIKPDNLWDAMADLVPRDFVLTSGAHAGEHLNIHIVMDHLLEAAEGDLRIMGVTSVLSQRMRNGLRSAGLDPNNTAGQMTVTMYNKVRYAVNPMFVIQRVTDAPYYSMLYGVMPLGKSALSEANLALREITDNIARSGLARHFSMDMPEFATRTNFTAGIKSAMQQAGLKENKLDRIVNAPNDLIAANMTNMLHARLGDMVRGALDNLAAAAEKNPELAAEMLQAGEVLKQSFADWRKVYSENAGRVLDDNEVGLRYLQDQLNSARRIAMRADGTLDFDGLLHEGTMMTPGAIGDMRPIMPDVLAQRLGYPNSAALRHDVTGQIKKVNGEFQLVKGEHDIAWLEEQLRDKMHAHADYTKRAVAYYKDTWDGFWKGLSQDIDKGGLDISTHYAKEAQDAIYLMARERGMDPWEYLSGVMGVNLGPTELNTAMGRLVNFLQKGPEKATVEDWGEFIRANVDPSGQTLLKDEWARVTGKAIGTTEDETREFFEKGIADVLRHRVANGVNPNPDVEAVIEHVARMVQNTLKAAPAEGQTRSQLRALVEQVPVDKALPYSRSQALIVSLLHNKIDDASQDVFRLAEMQTKRNVLERSLNHPLFGLYPASYMWGKVLPETVKFLAKNPYAATYTIANVQRSIAIQREYDRELDDKVGTVDRSAGAFLLDYLTPGLPWSDHEARMSPLVRDIFGGKDLGKIWDDELSTVSPHRWVSQVVSTLNEIPGAVDAVTAAPGATTPQWQKGLQGLAGGAAPAPLPTPTGSISGPTKASALAPILADDLSRLQSILLSGEDPEK